MKTKKLLFETLTITAGLMMMLQPCSGQSWVGTDNFTSGISTNWTVYQQNQGQMFAVATNQHLSFIVGVSATTEQNAPAIWNGTPAVSNDWTMDITGHNSASWSANGASQLQLWLVNSTNKFRIAMAGGHNQSNGYEFDTISYSAQASVFRQSVPATNASFGLRLVHRGGVAGDIEAWYDPTGNGLAWTLLDTMSMASFWPGVVAGNTFMVAIVSDTYYGPVAEGQIWADNFRITNSAIGSPLPLAQVQWAERIASAASQPEGDEEYIGMTLDTNGNCYVAGWFDGTNDFGGVTLTNQSVGGSDIFVTEYNSSGALQWAQRAGGYSTNYARAVGVDANGNVYVTGSAYGPANFGGINLTGSSGQNFFLAKYNNAGAIQWVQPSSGGSSDVYGIGLAVDSAGNSYALAVVDQLSGQATNITFGSTTVPIPATGETPLTILVKYDSTGTVHWTQLLGSSEEVYAPKVVLDAAGNVYVRGIFVSTLTIGTSNLVGSAGLKNMFIAKFSDSGNLAWVLQPQSQSQGKAMSDGGVAVDPAGDVYVSGMYVTNLNFGGGITLTNAGYYNAFLAKYNSSGAIQWARSAGSTIFNIFLDNALDSAGNVYVGGTLCSAAVGNTNSPVAVVSKYDPSGNVQWAYSANGSPATSFPITSWIAKCAVDSSNNCFLAGLYQGTNTFGTNALQPQETWNFFLAKLAAPAPLTLGIVLSNGVPQLSLAGAISSIYSLQSSPTLAATNTPWQTLATFPLTNSPQLYLDTSVPSRTNRFYRAGPPAL